MNRCHPLTMGVLLTSYHHLARSTFVGQFLNGRRYPRGAPAVATPHVSPGENRGSAERAADLVEQRRFARVGAIAVAELARDLHE